MDLQQLTDFFKYMTLINAGIFLLSAVLVMALKEWAFKLHSRLFGLRQEEVARISYGYLGAFRLLLIFFNLVPWVALLCLR